MPLNILIIGDIIGKAGRRALSHGLHHLVDQHMVDFVVGNGENLAAGFGLTAKCADEMFHLGIDVLTNGNHCWDQKDFLTLIDQDQRFVRPANFTRFAPGRGWTICETAAGHRIAVINLIGQVFMGGWECPFLTADRVLKEIPDDVSAILVDMHAEASSEKVGLAWYLDGQVSCVYGTHTHIPTCDEGILPQGTAHQCDIGMTGSYQSVIGMKVNIALKRMVEKLPQRFEPVERGGEIRATLLQVDPATKRALSIKRIRLSADELEQIG
ncbi:MAG: TIGR00282 family metallophosphoesterase [Mariprofundales bacterium]|nr:TIGR00282 family metallophosphoesterase [Mariprofundales bacterium]